MLVSRAHSYGIVIHYTTAAAVHGELREAGFAGEVEVYADDGSLLAADADTSRVPWLHVLARTPTTAV
jgi:hypothetical protein